MQKYVSKNTNMEMERIREVDRKPHSKEMVREFTLKYKRRVIIDKQQ